MAITALPQLDSKKQMAFHKAPVIIQSAKEFDAYAVALINAFFYKKAKNDGVFKDKWLYDEALCHSIIDAAFKAVDTPDCQKLIKVAAENLSAYPMKFMDSRIGIQHVRMNQHTDDYAPLPSYYFGSRNVEPNRTQLSFTGDASDIPLGLFLTAQCTHGDSQISLANLCETADYTHPLIKALIKQGIPNALFQAIHAAITASRNYIEETLHPLHKQIYFPLNTGEYHVITPIVHGISVADFHQTLINNDPNQGFYPTRTHHFAPDKPYNHGEIANCINGYLRNLESMPYFPENLTQTERWLYKVRKQHSVIFLSKRFRTTTINYLRGEEIIYFTDKGERKTKQLDYNNAAIRKALDNAILTLIEFAFSPAYAFSDYILEQDEGLWQQDSYARFDALEQAWLDPRRRTASSLSAEQTEALAQRWLSKFTDLKLNLDDEFVVLLKKHLKAEIKKL